MDHPHEGEFRFDWQKEPENSFWKWFLPHVLAQVPDVPGQEEMTMDDFEKLTNRYTDIRLTVQVNGVPVPTEHFMESVENNVKWAARAAAKEMYKRAGLGRLYDVVHDLQDEVREMVVTKFAEIGIELPEDR